MYPISGEHRSLEAPPCGLQIRHCIRLPLIVLSAQVYNGGSHTLNCDHSHQWACLNSDSWAPRSQPLIYRPGLGPGDVFVASPRRCCWAGLGRTPTLGTTDQRFCGPTRLLGRRRPGKTSLTAGSDNLESTPSPSQNRRVAHSWASSEHTG